MKIEIESKFYNAVIDRYLDGDFGIDFNKKKFFDLDSEELNLLGNFQTYKLATKIAVENFDKNFAMFVTVFEKC